MTGLFGNIIDWSALDAAGRRAALARPARRSDAQVTDGVRAIFDDVQVRGGAAVTDWSVKLDGAAPRRIAITEQLVADARADLPPAATRALRIAAENVRIFHQATRPEDSAWIETRPGVRSKIAWRPLGSAGLYVPGGTAPLFSSLLMLAIPAQVAGVERRVAVTPPSKDGRPHPAMIVAAAEAGLEDLWLIGGAQAIAALTFGAVLDDGEIEPVAKLFGPGNAWVAEAKKQAAALPGGPGVDMPAGPSELLVIADRDADAVVAAADLLSQAEHDADAQVVLVSESKGLIDAVLAEIALQLETLPRAEIARAALAEGRIIRVRSIAEACEVSNLYAPEHLAIQTLDADQWVPRITAAGAVFVGPNAAETLGDYAAGPSHVLPTDGGARTMGGVTTASFMTSMSVQCV
ncbi:MAG: histidinol dehydrogenase, partial [Brevundimonas sp.]